MHRIRATRVMTQEKPKLSDTGYGMTNHNLNCMAVRQYQIGMVSNPVYGDCNCGLKKSEEKESKP